jgi:hypothetical protein
MDDLVQVLRTGGDAAYPDTETRFHKLPGRHVERMLSERGNRNSSGDCASPACQCD